MKKNINLSFSLVFVLFLSILVDAQDINVYNYIGKRSSAIIKKYGKPVFRDRSNPNMDCMFYKSKTKKLVFVSDSKGVYQAEATAFFNSNKSAKKTLDKIIRNSILKKFTTDTLSTNNFSLHKAGVMVELRLTKNKYKKKYELYLKAMKYTE